jgi:glycosyltransferase involved in cell wall biosynthesis
MLGFPFSETNADWEHCAYSSRTRDSSTMLTRAGVETILYSGSLNTAECYEHVAVMTPEERRAWWPDYEPKRQVFNSFDPGLPGWSEFNQRAAAAIRERAKPGDILAMTMGYSQRPVAEMVSDLGLMVVETGVGYSGVWAPYRVYESKAWRDFLAAKDARDDMRAYDTVIPRAWLAEDFPRGPGGDYVLFVGRLTARKGPHVAADAARRLGLSLKVAGQGAASWSRTLIVCEDGTRLEGDVEYLGVLGAKERAEVMGASVAILTPTQYFEPLGGVSIEAQLTGTPAIVSNWGGLPENVIEGQTGFACDLLRDYVRGIEQAAALDRAFVRDHALATWSTGAIAPRFVRYFEKLETLRGLGWYS